MPPPNDKAARRANPEAHDKFKAQLVDIARQIFLTEGPAGVTIRRITAAAGVTPMAFYWYFDSKDALLSVIWAELLSEAGRFCAGRVACLPPAATADDKLLAFFEAFVRHWLENRDHFRFIFMCDAHKADFVELRKHLFEEEGCHGYFAPFYHLSRSCFADTAEGHAHAHRLRTLALYRAIGYLHCAITLYNIDMDKTTVQIQDLVTDLRQTLQMLQS